MQGTSEPLWAQLWKGDGTIVAGDFGLIALKSLLENGIGFLTTTESDAEDPISIAADGVRERLLAPLGVSLRTARSLHQLQRALTGLRESDRHRGALIVPDGTALDLSELADLDLDGGHLVVLCYDDAVLRLRDQAVFDPSAGPDGLREAIDTAFSVSATTSRPAFVAVRGAMLGMRGAMVARDNLTWEAGQDAFAPSEHLDVADALALLAPARAIRQDDATSTVVCTSSFEAIARQVARRLQEAGHPLNVVVATTPTRISSEAMLTSEGDLPEAILVIEDGATRLGRTIAPFAEGEQTQLSFATIAATDNAGAAAADAIANWYAVHDEQRDHLLDICARDFDGADAMALRHITDRLSPRGAMIAPGGVRIARHVLQLVHGALGVPSRVPGAGRTYQTPVGSFLTVAGADEFLRDGMACAHEAGRAGVFVIACLPNQEGEVAARVAEYGQVGSLSTLDPRTAAKAIALTCRQATGSPVFLLLVEHTAPQTLRPSGVQIGFEPELLGTDRTTAVAVAHAGGGLELSQDELPLAPVLASLDQSIGEPVVTGSTMLSSAWYEVRHTARPSWGRRFASGLSFRALRGLVRVEV